LNHKTLRIAQTCEVAEQGRKATTCYDFAILMKQIKFLRPSSGTQGKKTAYSEIRHVADFQNPQEVWEKGDDATSGLYGYTRDNVTAPPAITWTSLCLYTGHTEAAARKLIWVDFSRYDRVCKTQQESRLGSEFNRWGHARAAYQGSDEPK
jgi:hypothetical protein